MVNGSDMRRITDGERHVQLSIDFVDDNAGKTGTININGRLTTFDQNNATYQNDISDYVQEGNNYIELRPESVLNIVKLEVQLE
jgi:hypothetical protein